MLPSWFAPGGDWAHSPVAGALDATTQDHPGPATTVFGTVAPVEESGKAKTQKPRSEGHFAEGVGLEPTSPFGQRFSRPSACQLA